MRKWVMASGMKGLAALVMTLLIISSAAFDTTPDRPGRQQNRVLQEEIRVVYQLTDVLVKDREGNFVRGLGPGDFILTVDGREVAVRSVDEYEAPAVDDARIAEFNLLAEDARKRGLEPPEPPTPPRYVIIVFDRFNMGEAGIKESKETARRIVEEGLLPYDRVAVFQYNISIRTLTGPTSDRRRILEAINAAGGVSQNTHYRPAVEEIFTPDPDNFRDMDQLYILNIEKEIEFRNYLESIRVLALSLQSLPGRKNFLLFSEGHNVYNPMSLEKQSEIISRYAAVKNVSPPMEIISRIQRVSSNLAPHFVNNELKKLSRDLNSINSSIFTIRRGPIQPEWALGADQDYGGKVIDSWNLETNTTANMNDMGRARLDVLRDTARLTGGKFFDAGMSDEELMANLHEEIGNYYVLGFEPPTEEKGRFHKVKIKTTNPQYRVSHREGFFGKKPFSRLNSKERAVHLEEGFLVPGVLNELRMVARGYSLPMREPQSLVAFRIDADRLGEGEAGGRELEMVLNVEDRSGNIRFRQHKLFKWGGGELPRDLWLSLNVPLLGDGCAVYLAVRDNATGRRSTWREVFPRHAAKDGAVRVAEPIMLSTGLDGALGEWAEKTVKDGVKPVDPLAIAGIKIPGRPLVDNTVEQEGSANLLLLLGNVPDEFDPAGVSLTVDYVLDPDADESFLLFPEDQKVQFLASQRLLVLSVKLPLGLAQQPEGSLHVAVGGLFGGKLLLTSMPYRVDPFSVSKALKLLQNPNILKLPAEDAEQ